MRRGGPMNRSKLADLSEIVSSVAIVVTLVYLTIEIRQNTNALEAQTRQSVLASAHGELNNLVDNPDFGMALASAEPLVSPEDHIRMNAWFAIVFRSREFAWLQYEDGSIDEAQWSTELAVIRSVFDSSLARLWWANAGRGAFGEDFVAFVDDLIAESPATDSSWLSIATWSAPEALQR
jgi:hypothetical protein